jgi:acyl transferase domain-containing protein
MVALVEFARGVDHDAAAAVWDRYSKGERRIFTRSLYTMQGQQTFDEVRRRYRRDPEFRQTVERYLTEFERLLEDVAQDDPDEVIVRTYLMSDTGKVYTMLAHAAGRFD